MPGLVTWPLMQTILLPGLSSVPIALNQSGPLTRMAGTLARVSVLLTTVGLR